MIGALEFLLAAGADVTLPSGAVSKEAGAKPLSSNHAAVFSGRRAAPIARALCVGKDIRIFEIRGLGDAISLASFVVLRVVAYSRFKQVTIVNRTVCLRLLAALGEDFPDVAVNVLLPRGISWKSNGFRYLKDLILVQQKNPQLTLLSYSAGMSSFIRKLGGNVVETELRLPVPRCRPVQGPLTVLIGGGEGEIPSQGHIAAAVALAKRRLSDRIDKVVYEAGCSQIGRILETFGCPAQKVPSLDKCINRICGAPFVLVGPYPDGMTDSLALLALEKGGLALVAQGALPATGKLEQWLTVDYWEQADLIAHRVCELIDNYAEVQNLLIAPPENQTCAR